jgi:hypothetical protein
MNPMFNRLDRMDRLYRKDSNDIESIDSILESKLNMYERQIDQLFDFAYRDQDDIKTLFTMKDTMSRQIESIIKQINDAKINELTICIQNYYYLEIENKKRIEHNEWYQFQLFVIQIFIIIYLVYLKFY